MTDCQDDEVPVHFEKESPHNESVPLSDEEVDSWPLKVTFFTLMLNLYAEGPANGPANGSNERLLG